MCSGHTHCRYTSKTLRLSRPIVVAMSQGAAQASDDTVAYLEVKQQLLLSYCINVTFYMLLKVGAASRGGRRALSSLG